MDCGGSESTRPQKHARFGAAEEDIAVSARGSSGRDANPLRKDDPGSNPCSSVSTAISKSPEVEAALEETEFGNWIVNTKVLYDIVMVISLDWPSLTIQWLPGIHPATGSSTVKQRLLLGSHTGGAEEDSLLVMEVELPTRAPMNNADLEYRERGDYDGFHFGLSSYKVRIVKRLSHPKESNCARYMPQRPALIASCAVDGAVHLFDLEKEGSTEGPLMSFRGLPNGEATCLAWNPEREGRVASSSSAGSVAVFDAQAACGDGSEDISPIFLARRASVGINACTWAGAELLLSADEDGIIAVWDQRADPRKPVAQAACGGIAANCVSCHPVRPEIFLCGDDNGVLRLFDRRRLGMPVHETAAQTNEKVSCVSFSPHNPSLALSGGCANFVSIWDFDAIGNDQDVEDAEDGPPELVFTHGGHRSDIYDASWNTESQFETTIASVSDDNKLHIWKPKRDVFFDSSDESSDDDVQLE